MSHPVSFAYNLGLFPFKLWTSASKFCLPTSYMTELQYLIMSIGIYLLGLNQISLLQLFKLLL